MSKTALVTGVRGQDGAYLANFLLKKGYQVIGTARTNEVEDNWRLTYFGIEQELEIVNLDLTQSATILPVLEKYQPAEIYNLAAMSFVGGGYGLSNVTNVNATGLARIIDGIQKIGLTTKLFHASSSQIFGNAAGGMQNENTLFSPENPYAITKLYGHLLMQYLRKTGQLFACSGILFNHESPLRGANFVTKKIVRTVAEIKAGITDRLSLGNIHVERDWGFAGDYVEAMWLMLQQADADDYVLATGKTNSLKYLIEQAFAAAEIEVVWEGEGLEEVGRERRTGKILVDISPEFFRPTEVRSTLGDASKANKKLGWTPKISFAQLIELMLSFEFDLLKSKIA